MSLCLGGCSVLCILSSLLLACTPIAPVRVTLIADGQTRTLTTDAQTVGELLARTGITLDEDDRVVPPETVLLTDGMTVRVVRVEVRTETVQQTLPYGRETVRDATIPVGQTRLLRAGVNGVEELTYVITLEDGVEVERRLARRVTVQEPQNEILLVGAREEVTAVPISGTVAYLSAHNAWVMRGTTGSRRRLTATGDLDGRVFDLSPDGSRLLFTRTATETGVLNTLWLVDTVAPGAEPVRLPEQNVLWAAWSPDGEWIAYSTGTPRESPPGWEAANDLFVARPQADGRLRDRRRVLGPSAGGTYGWWGTTYAWAPAGEDNESTLLAYARADEIGLVDLSARKPEAVPLVRFPPFRTYAPWAWVPTLSWSPEGAYLVTVLHGPSPTGEEPEDSPVFDIYVLSVVTSSAALLQAKLVPEAGMWAAPLFSPEGEQILFGRARAPYASHTSTYDLYRMDRDGSDRRLLFPQDPREPGLEYPAAAWDPAGGRVLVVYRGDLWLVTVDGQARRVTEDGAITLARWQGK
ncbi:MAG: G5 domain-containing protein [Anaerolineae bacterium]|nr:G5 domain-containing protein [Anaerolineae bacterium]MDW8067891.1 G5 domain-containing protein [Anaerolineae bacterium]